MPRSTDPKALMPDYGGGYGSPYGYPGYGVPNQYQPRKYLPPLGSFLPPANQLAAGGADRQEKPKKKKKKIKGEYL